MKLMWRIIVIILRIVGSLAGLFFVLNSYFVFYKMPLAEGASSTDSLIQSFFAGLGIAVGLVILVMASGIYGWLLERRWF